MINEFVCDHTITSVALIFGFSSLMEHSLFKWKYVEPIIDCKQMSATFFFFFFFLPPIAICRPTKRSRLMMVFGLGSNAEVDCFYA